MSRHVRFTVLLREEERDALQFAAERRGISGAAALRMFALATIVDEYRAHNSRNGEVSDERPDTGEPLDRARPGSAD